MAKAIETGPDDQRDGAQPHRPSRKAAMEKQIKEQSEQMKKNKELNDAFNAGMEAMTSQEVRRRDRGIREGGDVATRRSRRFSRNSAKRI